MKASLALDRMTTDQLQRKLWELVYDVEPYNLGSLELRVRQQRWRQLKQVIVEIELRGIQLALDVSGYEEKARDGSEHVR